MAENLPAHPIVAGIGPEGAGTHAAVVGAQLAATLGCGLVLVFGYDLSSLGPRGGPLEESQEAIANEVLDAAHAEVAAAHPEVPVTRETVRDKAVDSLLRAADAFDARMIVVGHGGGGVLRAAVLGSTTYGLVHRATRPVLVVPDPDDESSED